MLFAISSAAGDKMYYLTTEKGNDKLLGWIYPDSQNRIKRTVSLFAAGDAPKLGAKGLILSKTWALHVLVYHDEPSGKLGIIDVGWSGLGNGTSYTVKRFSGGPVIIQ